MSGKKNLYSLGNVVWHTSDGYGPDVGISVGLGDYMLFAGEVPGMAGPWSLAIYPMDGDRIDIAPTIDADAARDMIERIGRTRQSAPPPASQ